MQPVIDPQPYPTADQISHQISNAEQMKLPNRLALYIFSKPSALYSHQYFTAVIQINPVGFSLTTIHPNGAIQQHYTRSLDALMEDTTALIEAGYRQIVSQDH